MTKKLEVYKCAICGNIVEVIHEGAGELVCCGQPMELLKAKKADEGKEKHVPVIEKKNGKVVVKVGSVPHPMEEKHHIEWIQIVVDGKAFRKFLNPGENPEAEFVVTGAKVEAREYCNIHGLWSS
ncbi:MAG: desulfoferrodoxin [Theionarchaea archaeon]|nr:desulfoferrodoxin [Theionarchaea archaeon]